MKIVSEILREGWDGKKCLVHARIAVHKNERLLTAQNLNVKGSDLFDALRVSYTSDGTFKDFSPDPAFAGIFSGDYRSVCCDMTPFYHRAADRFLVTGAAAVYHKNSLEPVMPEKARTRIPYAVFDRKSKRFNAVRWLDLPEKYFYAASGSAQLFEESDGTVFMPVSFLEKRGGALSEKYGTAVLRLSFDGEILKVLSISGDIRRDDDLRGIYEGSVIGFNGEYLLTLRGDTYGYVSKSRDGIHFTEPTEWKWKDGSVVPTYNTQSHWLPTCDGLYLVYTRKCGTNDHVFRHRAPLFAARVNPETLTLDPETEFVCVPERGARLGNFGACGDGDTAYVCASEWMQFEGCERNGSNNALYLVTVKPDE